MRILSKEEVNKVVTEIPIEIFRFLEDHPGLAIGGGFVRSVLFDEKPVDLDLFMVRELVSEPKFKSAEDFVKAFDSSSTVGIENAYTQECDTWNAATYGATGLVPVQFVKRAVFRTVDEIADGGFDFTVCCAVIYFNPRTSTWEGRSHKDFFIDNWNKKLVYVQNRPDLHGSNNVARLAKYSRKGFDIDRKNTNLLVASYLQRVLKDRPYLAEVLELVEKSNKNYY